MRDLIERGASGLCIVYIMLDIIFWKGGQNIGNIQSAKRIHYMNEFNAHTTD